METPILELPKKIQKTLKELGYARSTIETVINNNVSGNSDIVIIINYKDNSEPIFKSNSNKVIKIGKNNVVIKGFEVKGKLFLEMFVNNIEDLLQTSDVPDEVKPIDILAIISDNKNEIGLTFVPKVINEIKNKNPELSIQNIWEMFKSLQREQIIELRPESGLNRLSKEELAMCPPGPDNSRSSWTRIRRDKISQRAKLFKIAVDSLN